MSNMAKNRDTQFSGSARLLLLEMAKNNALALNWDKFFGEIELLISRWGYDLVCHAVRHIDPKDLDVLGFEEAIQRIPDMAEPPKEGARVMSDQDAQDIVELRTQIILEYMKLGPSIFDRTYEAFCKPGVTFTDEQSLAIQKRLSEDKGSDNEQ